MNKKKKAEEPDIKLSFRISQIGSGWERRGKDVLIGMYNIILQDFKGRTFVRMITHNNCSGETESI